VVEHLVRRRRRLEDVGVDPPKGHRVRDRRGRGLMPPRTPGHEQAPLGVRVEQAHAPEQLAARRPGERLSREHEGDLFPGVRELREASERLVRWARGDDPVAASIAVAQLPVDVAHGASVVVDGYEHGGGHAPGAR
jgi:hypothetical protein